MAQGAWLLNRTWIAETLCVNRDRPELNCDGSCQLTERMREHQERQDEERAALLEIVLTAQAAPTARVALASAPAHDADGVTFAVDPRDTGRAVAYRPFYPPRQQG